MFPIHYYHEINWTKIINRDVEKFNHIFLNEISKGLVLAKATEIVVQRDKVLFKGSFSTLHMLRLVTNNLLGPITEGHVEGLSSKDGFYVVSYYLNFKQLVVYNLLVLAGILLFLMLTPLPLRGIIFLMAVPVLTVIIGWLMAVVRFESFIQRILKETKLQD